MKGKGVNTQRNSTFFPATCSLTPVGSFWNQIEANNRLWLMISQVILVKLFVLYLSFDHVPITLAVFSGIPIAFAGGMICLAIISLEFRTVAGQDASLGIAVVDGVVMTTCLEKDFTEHVSKPSWQA